MTIKSRINEKLTCEGHTMLALCVIRKKIECLGCALREGADPWMPAGSLGWTALHFAAACGAEHCAKVLADAMRNKQDQRQGRLQDEDGDTSWTAPTTVPVTHRAMTRTEMKRATMNLKSIPKTQ